MDAKIKEALADVRTSTQELNSAVSAAATLQADSMKAELQAAGARARAVADSVRAALGAQNDAARKHLQLAMTSLDAFQRHTEAALKQAGEAMCSAVGHAQDEAHACAKEVREAATQADGKQPPRAGD